MTKTPLAAQVSLFQGSTNTIPVETLPLADVLQRIQDGTYRSFVEQLRQLLATAGKAWYDDAKKRSMAFTPAGVFTRRANAKLSTPSGLVHYDFDHPPNLADAKARLVADPWIVYAFISPSGDGLKVAVWADGIVDDATYKHAWRTVLDYLQRTSPDLAVANDKACKDISRLCYMSWDPDLYVNPTALLYAVPRYQPPAPKPKPQPPSTSAPVATAPPSPSAPLPADRRQRYAQQAIETAIRMIDASIPPTATSAGTRHETRLKAARLLGGYVAGGVVTYNEAYTALEAAVARNTDNMARSMQTIADGLAYGQQAAITFEDLEQERQAWLQAHSATMIIPGRPLATSASNGTPPTSATPQQTAAALLDTLRATPEEQRSSRDIFAAIDTLAALPLHEWAIWKTDAKALLGSRLNLNDLEKARNAAVQQDGPSATGSALAAELATTYDGQLAYDLTRQGWLCYGARLPGSWSESEEEVVLGEIREALTALLPDGFSWNLLQGVERLLRTHLHRHFAMAPPGWLPFPKGTLELETMTFHSHSPDRMFTWCLPYDYDPTATCPKTLAFFHDALNGAHGEVQVVRAFFKAIVLGRVDLQRYPEFIGPGGTGKGTTIRIAQALVGIENVVTTELKQLESNRFETSSLYGKRLITITDAERYSGPVNVLKAITGQDIVRMEEKFKRQRPGVVEGLVMVAANEPIQSADYTSGLERRRVTLVFRHRPKEPRDLLSIKGGVFQGELVEELPGILNWVLALPDSAMETLIRHTNAMVPSLVGAWAHALVDTNPLADWANRALVRDERRDTEGRPVSVNVGVAKQIDRSKSYECEDRWLYPNYRAWVDATGGKAIALRRFTGLLLDLMQNQLRLEWVGHTDDQHGSRFHGIRLRSPQDKDLLFITGLNPAPMMDVTDTLTDEPHANDGCDGCDRFLQKFSISPLPPLHPNGDARSAGDVTQGEGVPIGGMNGQNPSNLSHPSLVRGNGIGYPSHPSSVQQNAPLAGGAEVGNVGSPGSLAVGEWVWLLSADGVQRNATPYRILAIAPDPNAADPQTSPLYAQLDTTDTASWWPLAQCERADPPAPSVPNTDPPPSNGTHPLHVEPAFTTLRLTDPWCGVCKTNATYRTLPQGDGSEVYRCETCNTKVGSKAPPAANGTDASDALDYDEVVI